ncbi:ATPase, partial [Methylobacterium hispanicum]
GGVLGSLLGEEASKGKGTARTGRRPRPGIVEQVVSNAARSMARSVGKQVGDAILRNVLGGLTKK